MPLIHFITHPEVVIDPAVPVTEWPLSARGRQRMQAALAQPWARATEAVFCSTERKAREAAAILAAPLGLQPVELAALGENDRSATGYLPRAAFEAMADAFFAAPRASIRGWERAADAQARILAALQAVLAEAGAARVIAIVAHGAVGALLLSHRLGRPISRAEDQPGDGGGQIFSFQMPGHGVVAGWRRIDEP